MNMSKEKWANHINRWSTYGKNSNLLSYTFNRYVSGFNLSGKQFANKY